MSRNLEISFQCSAQAIKNTTLCKLHKVPNGLRTMGSNVDQVPRHNPKGLCESQLGPGSSVLVSKVAKLSVSQTTYTELTLTSHSTDGQKVG